MLKTDMTHNDKINHRFKPGDLIGHKWEVNGETLLTGLYLIYDKKDITFDRLQDITYTSYKGWVVYTYDPFGRDDRSGLLNVGDTYEITHWNDMEVMNPEYPNDWVIVVESGLSWGDRD